jgi:hypothetical protein
MENSVIKKYLLVTLFVTLGLQILSTSLLHASANTAKETPQAIEQESCAELAQDAKLFFILTAANIMTRIFVWSKFFPSKAKYIDMVSALGVLTTTYYVSRYIKTKLAGENSVALSRPRHTD